MKLTNADLKLMKGMQISLDEIPTPTPQPRKPEEWTDAAYQRLYNDVMNVSDGDMVDTLIDELVASDAENERLQKVVLSLMALSAVLAIAAVWGWAR